MAVTAPNVSGEPFVGQTLTCSEPAVTGGIGPYQFDYFWVDDTNAMIFEDTYMGSSTVVVAYDIGKNMKCLVQVTDKGWSHGESITVASNSVGPVQAQPIGDITATVMGTPYDLAAGMAFSCSIQTEFPIAVQISGGASVTYNWSVRGDKTVLFSDPISASTDIAIISEGVVTVQCNIQSTDESKSAAIQFFAEDF